MVYRKGEMTKAAVDRGWPHQVALPDYAVMGHRYRTVHYFIAAEKLSLCPRGHAFQRDRQWYNVFCFAEREHAERFLARFGGEVIDQSKRPRWPGDAKR
jgi:hypothetical protein